MTSACTETAAQLPVIECPVPEAFELHQYTAEILRVKDGDTYEASIDLGFNLHQFEVVRLKGYDTPEIRGVIDKVPGELAMHAAENWFIDHAGEDGKVIVRLYRDRHHRTKYDNFGRLLAEFYPAVGKGTVSLGEHLVKEGHAIAWP